MMMIKLILLLSLIAIKQIYTKNVSELLPIDKRDEVLAFLFNYGDPKFEYPSIIKLSQACDLEYEDHLHEMMKDLLSMIRDHYRNEVVISVAQLMFNGPLIPDEECRQSRGPQSRAAHNQIKDMNARRFDAKDYREFLEIALTEAIQPDTEFELPLLACYLKLWMEKTIEKYPAKNGIRNRVKKHTHMTFDPVIKYLEGKGLDKVTNCDFMNLPRRSPHLRFKSIQLNLLEAIDNISEKSLTFD